MPSAQPLIRPETAADAEAVRAVNALAFGRAAEADLVDALRQDGLAAISLVGCVGNEVVGHILFSPVAFEPQVDGLRVAGLGPMAVRPDRQREGIGSALVRAGLAACREAGFDAVVVLGHPAYYPRFGFRPSVDFGFRPEFDVPDEVFMALELRPGALGAARDRVVRYAPAFRAA